MKAQQTAVVISGNSNSSLQEVVPGQAVIFKDMAEIMKGAELMANAKHMVPDHLLGNPGSCMAIIMQAQRWGMDVFAVAQKTHVISGKLGYEAQLVNAVVQASGMIEDRFHYEYDGEGAKLACRVGATLRGEAAVTWGEWLSFSDVTVKNSPLWKTNPKQQLGYLQVKNWARAFCPGAIMGVYTPDELEPIAHHERDIGGGTDGPKASSLMDDLRTGAKTQVVEQAEEAVIVADNTKSTDSKPEPDSEQFEESAEELPLAAELTFAQVADAINSAKSPETLQAAVALMADFIGIEGNDQYKEELSANYRAQLAKLKAAKK